MQCVIMNVDDLPMGPFWYNFSTEQNTDALKTASASNPPITRPPMGFNSWNAYHCNIDENVVRATAQAMIDNGMHGAGYEYVSK